jgi:hypothetical protein
MTKTNKLPEGADIVLGKSTWDWHELSKSDPNGYYAAVRDALVARYRFGVENDRFVDSQTGRILESKNLNSKFARIVPTDKKGRKVPASQIFLSANNAPIAEALAYRPGRPGLFEENGEWLGNYWIGLQGKPDETATDADVKPWTDHVLYICNGDQEDAKRLIDFFACLVKWPHVKIRRMPLIYGLPGTGKGLLVKPFELIISLRNIRYPDKGTLISKFNGWSEKASFAICEEFLLNSLDEFERIKRLCTDDNVEVENKGKDHRLSRNYCNLISFTNHHVACPIPQGERRIDYYKCTQSALTEEQLMRLAKTFMDQDFCSKMMGWLMKRDLSKFNPNTPAVWSKAKEELFKISADEHDGWLDNQLLANEAPFGFDVISVNDVFGFMQRERGPKTNVKLIANWLSARGHVNLGQQGTGKGRKVLWAIRDHDRWKKAANEEIWAEYCGEKIGPKLVVNNVPDTDSEIDLLLSQYPPERRRERILDLLQSFGRRGDRQALEYLAELLGKVIAQEMAA